jgi:hypothetical protein
LKNIEKDKNYTFISVAEPHHFYAAAGENFDAAPDPAAPAPAPTQVGTILFI